MDSARKSQLVAVKAISLLRDPNDRDRAFHIQFLNELIDDTEG